MTLIKIDSKNNQTKEVLKPVNLDIEKESKIKIWLVDPTYTQQQKIGRASCRERV